MHRDTLIFSEPARWEEYERFHQIAEILKQKYGKRISDLVPTEKSEMWLYGDRWTAPDYVNAVREFEIDFGNRAGELKQPNRFLCFDFAVVGPIGSQARARKSNLRGAKNQRVP